MNTFRKAFIAALTKLSQPGWARIPAEGNHPIPLNDQEFVWIVESGRVDIFAAQVGPFGENGRRRHLARFEVGDCFFGCPPSPADHLPNSAGIAAPGEDAQNALNSNNSPEEQAGNGFRLIALGGLNTALIRVSLGFFLDRLSEQGPSREKHAELLHNWLREWVDRLTEGLLPGLPPRTSQQLEPGKNWEPSGSQSARTHIFRWCRHLESPLRWLGLADFPPPDGGPFPLSPKGWIESAGNGRMQVSPTDERLTPQEVAGALDTFFRAILAATVHLARQERARNEERRCEREMEIGSSEAEARNCLLRLPGSEETASVFVADAGDPLLGTFRLICESMGVPLPRIRPSPSGRIFNPGRLAEIANAAGVRYRRVLLNGPWWEQECGPILAFFEETKEPVALLPNRETGYRLVAPSEPRKHPIVDVSIASQLNPFGYVLYRSFPDRVISFAEMMFFGLRGSGTDIAQLLGLSLLAALLSLGVPLITGIIFDRAIPESNQSLLLEGFLALLVAAVVSAIWEYARIFPTLRSETRMNASVQTGIVDRLLRLPTTFFRRFSTGDLTARAMSVNETRQEVGSVALDSVFQIISIVCQLGIMAWYSPQLATWAAGIGFVGTSVMVAVGAVIRHHLFEQMTLQARQTSFIMQSILGIAKLKVAGAEQRAFRSWAETFCREKRAAFAAGDWQNFLETFNAGFPIFASVVLFYAMVDQLLKARISAAAQVVTGVGAVAGSSALTLGQFLAFNAAVAVFISAMIAIGNHLLALMSIIPELERMQPILATIPEVTGKKADPGELSGLVDLSRVFFRYHKDGAMVLNDLSFQVRPGEFVALVGPSGSGKSTLLRLLLGFETPESGGVRYDGRNLADLDISAVRRQIGVVLQSGRLSAGSVFQLIAGNGQYTLDDAWEAARDAGLAEDVEAMPMQMHTVIGDGGTTLSGGQRQRLLIARALIKKPRIIFFDEATSALDNRTQSIVSESLCRLHATRIVIAHRLSTIRFADRIIVLQAGKAVESGSFEELMNLNGVFATLARRQLA
ncbi:MAG: NHLP bacteriocin export ABC transporter permease/ATPase subunit [Candidatus Ozemobacteraceae bacterium]